MTDTVQKKRSERSGKSNAKPVQRQTDGQKDTAAQRKVMRSAYLQTKMAVSSPGDTQEQEADKVAEEISRMPKGVARTVDDTVLPGSSTPQNNAEEPQSLQTKISRMPEEQETALTKAYRTQNDEEALQTKLFRQEEESDPAPAEEVDTRGETAATETEDSSLVTDDTEQKIAALRGQGNPLPDDVRQDMEEKMQADFSRVSIHTGGDADTLCKQLNARAFTVGSDIFFAAGEYAPTTEAGRKLLAHELTHVVQQGSSLSRKIYRDTGSTAADNSGTGTASGPPSGVTHPEPIPAGGPYEFTKDGKAFKYIATGSPKELHLPEVRIPNFKQRHQSLHPTPLAREKGERSTNQRQSWRTHFTTAVLPEFEGMLDSARRRGGVAGEGTAENFFFKGTRNQQLMLFGTREQLLNHAVFPFWDRQQQTRTFQVDHRREDQLGGRDILDNYELLDAQANGSSGSQIAREINSQIGTAVGVLQSSYYRSIIGGGARRISGDPSYIKENYNLQFNSISYNLGSSENGDKYWSVSHITNGEHLAQFRPLTEREVELFGNPRRPMLFTSPNGGIGVRAPESAGQRVEIWPRVVSTSALTIVDDEHATLTVDAYKGSDNPNGLHASYPGLTFHFQPVPGMESAGSYKSWAINKQASLAAASASGSGGVFQSLRLPGMSPVRVDELDLDPGQGFIGRGKLLPTVPVFANADIDVVIQGSDIRLQKTFSFNEITVPAPFEIYHSSITAFMGTQGLGLEGLLGFGINRIGDGEISAQIATGTGLSMDGKFKFDERLFGAGTSAEVRVGYANEQWSMGGTLTIPEGKVPGISSATINVNYSEGDGFSARGDATLDIPGIESGTIEITQSEETGFAIGGTFNLSPDVPGIRGGSISVSLRENPDGSGYALSATGEAQPDIPGINSNFIVSYNDGAFTAEISADYSRGMLSGRVNAGITNRSVGEDGVTLSDTAEPGSPLIVYGGGSLSLQLAPWLQATAGVQFAPNGEITVTGEIGLPSQLEIFARREINKSIFNIAVQAPIFPGIVAEVGGGLSATAGIGPGVIDQLRLGITYNPDREEDTRITGDAHLNIPANAGLRLSVRAGIGLGITGASATGGLDIGGTLGIEGAAEAGVHVDWTPTEGLDLTAELAVHAQPSFTFDIGGYVSVRALGFSVYDERWQLASYTFGSDYRFGIRLPIHYKEGEPFDVSVDDVEFEVPDIDTNELLRGLIARIT